MQTKPTKQPSKTLKEALTAALKLETLQKREPQNHPSQRALIESIITRYHELCDRGDHLEAYTLFKSATKVFFPYLNTLIERGEIVRARDFK